MEWVEERDCGEERRGGGRPRERERDTLTADLSGRRMLSTLRVRNMTGLEPPLLEDETGGLLQREQMVDDPCYASFC